jgi:hypothetical protein
MKKLTGLLSLASLLASVSLVSAKSHAVIRENGGFVVPAAAVIELVSRGNGIDTELKNSITKLINRVEEGGYIAERKEKIIGFEGEVAICVLLNNLEVSQKLNQKLLDLVSQKPDVANIKFVSDCSSL